MLIYIDLEHFIKKVNITVVAKWISKFFRFFAEKYFFSTEIIYLRSSLM